MTHTKICTMDYCKEEFEKPHDLSLAKWALIKNCPRCRKRNHYRPKDCKRSETNLGRYEVKSEIIDRFLYGP